VTIRSHGLFLAWVVALTATLGSLYFSEVRGFIPCALCWYQRVLMYPLVILLGVASHLEDKSVIRYTLPLSVLGGGVALYHYLIQKVPGMTGLGTCGVGVPCNAQYIDWLGFITIPLLSLTAFTLISGLLYIAGVHAGKEPPAFREAQPD
jgi:disulfide bond formation protein DsbB